MAGCLAIVRLRALSPPLEWGKAEGMEVDQERMALGQWCVGRLALGRLSRMSGILSTRQKRGRSGASALGGLRAWPLPQSGRQAS